MKKAGGILGRVDQLKFANVERIHLGKIGAAAFFHIRQHVFELLIADCFASKQSAQRRQRRVAVNFRQQVDQKLRLCAIMR
jgi:hypothetical protein